MKKIFEIFAKIRKFYPQKIKRIF